MNVIRVSQFVIALLKCRDRFLNGPLFLGLFEDRPLRKKLAFRMLSTYILLIEPNQCGHFLQDNQTNSLKQAYCTFEDLGGVRPAYLLDG
jgi:hypothetical protein